VNPEGLAAIKARQQHAVKESLTTDCVLPDEVWTLVEEDVPALLAEVERLRAALREIGETVVADTDDWMIQQITSLVDGALAEGAA
jgi:hypothetical protein